MTKKKSELFTGVLRASNYTAKTWGSFNWPVLEKNITAEVSFFYLGFFVMFMKSCLKTSDIKYECGKNDLF